MPILSSRGAGSAKGFGLTSGKSISYPYTLEYLVVAGGGAGGYAPSSPGGGGGGAGGLRSSSNPISGPSTITVTVGGGGTVGQEIANNGIDSSVASPLFATFTSTGGGKGAIYNLEMLVQVEVGVVVHILLEIPGVQVTLQPQVLHKVLMVVLEQMI
jgi:hypothetical protein